MYYEEIDRIAASLDPWADVALAAYDVLSRHPWVVYAHLAREYVGYVDSLPVMLADVIEAKEGA